MKEEEVGPAPFRVVSEGTVSRPPLVELLDLKEVQGNKGAAWLKDGAAANPR